MNIYYHLISNNGLKNVVAIRENNEQSLYQADSNHPHFNTIVEALDNGDPAVWDLFDVGHGVQHRLRSLSSRVSYDENNHLILFDGDPVHSVLADHVLRVLNAGNDFTPLVKFWERLAGNPSQRSREQLYDWLQANNGFTIDQDGLIVGYRGVMTDREGNYVSRHGGIAFVDGEEVNGSIPNAPGTTISMPRSKVNDDPETGCSYGLHVGTYNYASGWTLSDVLEVRVDPVDVVSVPSDVNFEKLRTCKFYVVGPVDSKHDAPVLDEYDDGYEWDVSYSD